MRVPRDCQRQSELAGGMRRCRHLREPNRPTGNRGSYSAVAGRCLRCEKSAFARVFYQSKRFSWRDTARGMLELLGIPEEGPAAKDRPRR